MATVVVSIEQRYDRTPDGKVWAPMFDYSFWKRYLDVFDNVRVVARVRNVPIVQSDFRRADGKYVEFTAVPYYLGPWQYLLSAMKVRHATRKAIKPSDAIIMRVDSQIAACMYPFLRKTGHPYGVEVVVDPYDVFSPGAIKHPFRSLFRWKFVYQLKQQCAASSAAAYVTREALQRRYPALEAGFRTHYSSVELPEAAFVKAPRLFSEKAGKFTIITVAYLEDLRKAPDVLINAIAVCVKEGLDLHLAIVGDGKKRKSLEDRVARLGIAGRVQFLGQVSSCDVFTHLDRSDLFVLPSRGEGLPRALIEAMARGLPAIGSTVGGFPELLPGEDLVPPGNVFELAKKIREVLSDPNRMFCMSSQNIEKAKEFHQENLRLRRIEFYNYLKDKTRNWRNGT